VSICHERYIQLDNRLQKLEHDVSDVKKDVVDGQKSLRNTIITTSGGIIVAILTLLGTIITLFADKI
jgi:hypothetical protein